MVRRACCAGTRDFCPGFAAQVGPKQSIFLQDSFYTLIVPIAQQAGQAVVSRHLSLNKWLWT